MKLPIEIPSDLLDRMLNNLVNASGIERDYAKQIIENVYFDSVIYLQNIIDMKSQGINWQPIDSFVIEENINKNILLLAKNKHLFYAPVTEDNLHSDGLVLIRNMEWGNFYSYESIKGITHWALIGDREVNQNAN